MMGRILNEPPIKNVYSNMFIQPDFLGRGSTGDDDLRYHQMEFFPYSLLSSFLFPFCSTHALPAASKALSATFVILSALSAASEPFSATCEALSAASEGLLAASEALSAASEAL